MNQDSTLIGDEFSQDREVDRMPKEYSSLLVATSGVKELIGSLERKIREKASLKKLPGYVTGQSIEGLT